MAAFCVGHWPMNDNDGETQVDDISGNNNHGTAQQITSDLHTDSNNPPYLNGALTFDGVSDYVDVGNVIGSTGAYTKVAWVQRQGGNQNNIISASTWSHVFWAPSENSFKLSAGHNYFEPGGGLFLVQDDTGPLLTGVWYFVAVTFDPNVESGKMVLYKNGVQVDDANNVPIQLPGTTYIGQFLTNYNFMGSIDNVMIFDKALSQEEISYLYNNGDGTETIPGGGLSTSDYIANGWSFDINEDFAMEVDFHYGSFSDQDGWVGITVENADSYFSISAGSDSNESYFYYESIVDGNTVFEQEVRDSNDGTLYISYDADSNSLYLSHTGYGDANAYVWQTAPDPLQGQSANVAIGGGSAGAALGLGDAYLDNFEVTTATLLGWPPATDLDSDGFIGWGDVRVMSHYWLDINPGDINGDGIVNFKDLAEFGLAW